MNVNNYRDFLKSSDLRHLNQYRKSSEKAAKYIEGYMVFCVLAALEEIDAFDYLIRNDNRINLNEYSEKKGFNSEKIKACLDYLCRSNLAYKSECGNCYSLEPDAYNMVIHGLGYITVVNGYSNVFHNLEKVLKNDMHYNQDVFRDGERVGRGSGSLARGFTFPFIEHFLKKNSFKNILDLGCGDAEFIIDSSKKMNISAKGIDLSADVIEYAKRRISSEGLADKIEVYEGDIFEIDQVDIPSTSVDFIISSYVLHEFFYKDENGGKLKSLLLKLRDKFPSAKIMIAEVTRKEDEHLKSDSNFLSEHHLWHDLSDQGLPSLESWCKAISDSCYTLEDVHYEDKNSQAFMLLSPTNNIQ